jgi:hypothetical protein
MTDLQALREYYAEELRAVANLQSEAVVRAFRRLLLAGCQGVPAREAERQMKEKRAISPRLATALQTIASRAG